MRFTKMQGIGNDYIYVNCFREPMPPDPPVIKMVRGSVIGSRYSSP